MDALLKLNARGTKVEPHNRAKLKELAEKEAAVATSKSSFKRGLRLAVSEIRRRRRPGLKDA